MKDNKEAPEVHQALLDQLGYALPSAPIHAIARVIRNDWKNVYFGAKPYLAALETMNKISDNYGADSGISIAAYFLTNAASWRGPVARLIKKELSRRINSI